MSKMRVVAYARVSTLLQENADAQLGELRRVGQARGWEIVGEFVETASGADRKRPQLAAALGELRAGRAQALAAVSIDRVARSLSHLLDIAADLSAWRCELICPRDGQIDTTTSVGRAFLAMRGIFAEFERELSRERAREYAAHRKALGLPHGRGDTLGAEALGIALQLRLASPPLSWRAICRVLADQGYGAHEHATVSRRVRAALDGVRKPSPG